MHNGSCAYGVNCRFNHPDPVADGGSDHFNEASDPASKSWSSNIISRKTVPYLDNHSFLPHWMLKSKLNSPQVALNMVHSPFSCSYYCFSTVFFPIEILISSFCHYCNNFPVNCNVDSSTYGNSRSMGMLVGYSLKDNCTLHVRFVYLCFVLNQMEVQHYEINLNHSFGWC